jgi:KTSC domain
MQEEEVERVSVVSPNVASVGYDPERGILEVEFGNGSGYWYWDVPLGTALELINASSVGGYLAAHIKGYFRYERKW